MSQDACSNELAAIDIEVVAVSPLGESVTAPFGDIPSRDGAIGTHLGGEPAGEPAGCGRPSP